MIWVIGFGGLSVVIGLALAVALNKPAPRVGIYRSAIYLPMVVLARRHRPVLAGHVPARRADQRHPGALGHRHRSNTSGSPTPTPRWRRAHRRVWRQVGYIMVLYLAGLKGCDPTLEEAAAVDGATAWQRFRLRRLAAAAQREHRDLRGHRDRLAAHLRHRLGHDPRRPVQQHPAAEHLHVPAGFTQVNLGYGSAIAVVIFLLAIGFIITYLVRATRGGLT